MQLTSVRHWKINTMITNCFFHWPQQHVRFPQQPREGTPGQPSTARHFHALTSPSVCLSIPSRAFAVCWGWGAAPPVQQDCSSSSIGCKQLPRFLGFCLCFPFFKGSYENVRQSCGWLTFTEQSHSHLVTGYISFGITEDLNSASLTS